MGMRNVAPLASSHHWGFLLVACRMPVEPLGPAGQALRCRLLQTCNDNMSAMAPRHDVCSQAWMAMVRGVLHFVLLPCWIIYDILPWRPRCYLPPELMLLSIMDHWVERQPQRPWDICTEH